MVKRDHLESRIETIKSKVARLTLLAPQPVTVREIEPEFHGTTVLKSPAAYIKSHISSLAE
ncbi:hypothetical protein [Anatilimnocola floriformis]|uniref:hypothetical protein n=1 Tax=Anatilimnocola floriformis TaxID=2948575 RepID=UPI0020C42ACB|nr:hypothetical protein [Anatilimnocola floriformis]